MTNKFQEYADLKTKIKELQDKVKELEGEVYQELFDIDGNKLETKFATFSIMYRPKWAYSDKLTIKEKMVKTKIKLLKKQEETSGDAKKVSDGGFLRCQLLTKKE